MGYVYLDVGRDLQCIMIFSRTPRTVYNVHNVRTRACVCVFVCERKDPCRHSIAERERRDSSDKRREPQRCIHVQTTDNNKRRTISLFDFPAPDKPPWISTRPYVPACHVPVYRTARRRDFKRHSNSQSVLILVYSGSDVIAI